MFASKIAQAFFMLSACPSLDGFAAVPLWVDCSSSTRRGTLAILTIVKGLIT